MRFALLPAVVMLMLFGVVHARQDLIRSPEQLARLLADFDANSLAEHPQAMHDQIDQAAGQKDAVRSRLFWYTDLNQALVAAKEQNKPVLSLRLLGRLDEELSCANSRFFRKTLYVDPALTALLRAQFILHWESLRPVPTITIDFGDGRQVKRTITGNSIHYILSPEGTVIDALPGMYDVRTFTNALQRIANINWGTTMSPQELLHYRRDAIASLLLINPVRRAAAPRPADRASDRALVKRIAEGPTLAATRNPGDSVAADTALNQRQFRPQILQWLNAGADRDLPALNKRIYAELFLAPLDDPDMGLNPSDETALAR
ncbi:MAG TPA: hypothetical protein VGB55_00395 [Tepidisphaeraceae bacterium]|jgi:hypothetical protein